MSGDRADAVARIDAIVVDCRTITARQSERWPTTWPVTRPVPASPESPEPAIRLSDLTVDQLAHFRAGADALLRERQTPVPAEVVEATVKAVPLRYEANETTPFAYLFRLREAARSLRLRRWPVESVAAGLNLYAELHHPDDVRAGLVALAVAEGLADAVPGTERAAA